MMPDTIPPYPFAEFAQNQGSYIPYTWAMQNLIKPEVTALQEKLSAFGITTVLVGQEMEMNDTLFSMPCESKNQYWLEVKNSILGALDKEMKSAIPDTKLNLLKERQKEIAKFQDRDVFMYDLIELNKDTSPYLQKLFGTSTDGDGYYDSNTALELKLNSCSANEHITREYAVLSAIAKKSTNIRPAFRRISAIFTPKFQLLE